MKKTDHRASRSEFCFIVCAWTSGKLSKRVVLVQNRLVYLVSLREHMIQTSMHYDLISLQGVYETISLQGVYETRDIDQKLFIAYDQSQNRPQSLYTL